MLARYAPIITSTIMKPNNNSIDYPSIASITTAPIADSTPMIAVAIITLADIKLKPITSSCSSSSSAGNENTAMNTSGACRLNKNILFSFLVGSFNLA